MQESMFDVESIKEEANQELRKERMMNDDLMPAYGSEDWNDYVMSKFKKGEQFDGNPTCAGLRRVADELLGTIVVSRPSQVWPATDINSPGRATVVFEIVIDWMDSGQLRTFSDVADVWHGNTDDLFCAHPVATASTRAEGRALRKALKIKAIAAEELAKKDIVSIVRQAVDSKPSDGEWKDDDMISAAQINFIDTRCQALNINVDNFINMGEKTYAVISHISKDTAVLMLKTLTAYQNKSKVIPDDLGAYTNWR